MARWRLTAAHYLNVEGIEWDYIEKDQQTQRNKRVHFKVPLHLDPNSSADWNDKANEWVVVSDGVNPSPRDIIFTGPPTPDMEPLDAEAEALTAVHRKRWDANHPIESLPGQDYSQSLLTKFQAQVDERLKALSGTYPTDQAYAKGIDPTAFEALQNQVAELAKQNSALIAMLQRQMEGGSISDQMRAGSGSVSVPDPKLEDKEEGIRQEMRARDLESAGERRA